MWKLKRRRHGEAQGIIPVNPREALQARPSLSFEATSTTRTGLRNERARLRQDHYDARRGLMHRTPGSLATASASSRSSRLTIRRSPRVPHLAAGRSPVPAGPAAGLLTSSPSWPAWLSLRSCDWQGKGARLTSQRPRPRHPCLKSLSEIAHFIAFMAFASLAYQPRPQILAYNSLHAHMTFIAFKLQLCLAGQGCSVDQQEGHGPDTMP